MAIDGFFIKNLIKETKEVLLNSRLQKISLNKKDIFVLNFYLKGKSHNLNVKLNPPYASMFISNDLDIDNSLSSNFIVNLNKNISGYILTNITQHLDDRVILLEFAGNDFLEGKVTKTLILEFMGRYNNMILIKDNIIIDSYNKNVSSTNRSIVPKIKYEYFETNKVIFNNNYSSLENDLSLSKSYLGISPLLSKYLFINNKDLNEININPTLNINNNKFYWFDLFESNNKKHFTTLSKMLNYLVLDSFNIKDNRYLNFITKKQISNLNKLNNLKEDLNKSNNNLKYMDYGNYIYSSGLNLNKHYSELTTYDNKIIKLDSKLTLLENALKFFKTYEKAKRSITHLENQIVELKNLITLLNEIEYEINSSYLTNDELNNLLSPFGLKNKKQRHKKKKTSFKDNITKIEYNNAIFYVGKNNIQNEYIVSNLANSNDYWFHIKDSPGSHVILKGELNDLNLEFGSMLAAYYSRERDNPLITINYTKVRNLKKIPNLPAYNVILKTYQSINIKINNDLLKKYVIAN